MTKFKCTDIDWDTDEDEGLPVPKLPTEVIVELDDEDVEWAKNESEETLPDMIVDALSDKIGWLVNSYCYEEVK